MSCQSEWSLRLCSFPLSKMNRRLGSLFLSLRQKTSLLKMNRTPLSWIMDNLDEEKYGETRVLVIVNDQAKAPSKSLLRRSKERERNRRYCTSSGIFISSSPDRPEALDRHANPSERSSESTSIMSPAPRNVSENPENPYPLSFESPCSVLITDPSRIDSWNSKFC